MADASLRIQSLTCAYVAQTCKSCDLKTGVPSPEPWVRQPGVFRVGHRGAAAAVPSAGAMMARVTLAHRVLETASYFQPISRSGHERIERGH